MAVEESEVNIPDEPAVSEPLSKAEFEALARFRFGIRRYLRISEEMVRAHGVTPAQYQLMLALMGYPGREWATVQELAELIQLRHHSVVELVNRAQKQGLVERRPHPSDARAVRVSLTAKGEQTMSQLGALHRDELHRLGPARSRPWWIELSAALGNTMGTDRGPRPLPENEDRTGG